MMTITQLLHFKTIAEFENISRAAQKLFISQSALSMSLKKTETELGRPLFDRHKNQLRLNQDGKELLTHANVILSECSAIEHTFCQRSLSAGISICSPLNSFSRYCIPKLKKAFPSIPINSSFLSSEKSLDALFFHEADIILSPFQYENEPRVSSDFLTEEYLIVAVPASHPLSSRETLFYSDIDQKKFLLSRSNSYNWNFFCQCLKEHKIRLDIEACDDAIVYYNITPQVKDCLMITSNFGKYYFNKEANVRFLPLEKANKIQIYAVFLKENTQKYAPVLSAIHGFLPLNGHVC